MPSDSDRARALLAYANYAKVANALLVSRAAVAEWAKGRSVTPYRLRQLEQLLRPDLQTQKDAPPEWAGRIEGLVRAIAAATPGVQLDEVEETIRRVDELERSQQQHGESHRTGDHGIRGGSAK